MLLWRKSKKISQIDYGTGTKGAIMKLSKYGLLLTILTMFFLTVSCNNFSTHTDSSSVTAIDQPWLENKPVTVSVMSDTQTSIIVSDSTATEHILALVGNLTCYETSSEVIMGGYPTLTLAYPGRW